MPPAVAAPVGTGSNYFACFVVHVSCLKTANGCAAAHAAAELVLVTLTLTRDAA